jgi:nicotinamidase-related amidase
MAAIILLSSQSGEDRMPRPTLRELVSAGNEPASLSQSALIIIDAQNTYREGVMQLEGVEEALVECKALLARARAAKRPVIHIIHDAGPGSPYDIREHIGQIADPVAALPGEAIIAKAYPSSFEKTELDARLKALGVTDIILAGFMTHMCVNSTARAGFNHGYRPTVVASCTATRSLPVPTGGSLTAKQVHDGALTAIADLFAVVTADVNGIPA